MKYCYSFLDSAETVSVSSTVTAATTALTTSTSSTSQTAAAPTTSVNSQWPSFPPSMPYMANPYQHFGKSIAFLLLNTTIVPNSCRDRMNVFNVQ